MLSKRTGPLIVLILTATFDTFPAVAQSKPCSPGWFGTHCNFMCHCVDGTACDAKTGNCSGGCAEGFFDHACQYKYAEFEPYPAGAFGWLTDGDPTTCSIDWTLVNVTLTLTSPQYLTWVSISVSNNDLSDHFSLSYRALSRSEDTPCGQEHLFKVSYTRVKIYCPTTDLVESITMHGAGVSVLCDVYINAGRNVALKQATAQSSTLNQGVAAKAVNGLLGNADDSTADFYKACTHTRSDQPKGVWTLTFSHPAKISRIVIFNRWSPKHATCCEERLNNFQLQVYRNNSEASQVFSYTDQSTGAHRTYTVVPSPPVTEAVQRVKVTTGHSTNILTMCEVQVYGELVCESGHYGLDCSRVCDCPNSFGCSVTEGNCLCKPGFVGSHCRSPCDEGHYGMACSQRCSPQCQQSRKCDHETGHCEEGCQPGYHPPLCDRACESGRYGLACAKNCSGQCSQPGRCDHETGECERGCQLGYNPPLCLEACPVGTYGVNCTESCSGHCEKDAGLCEPDTGHCPSGCKRGYIGPKCDQECPSGTFGSQCSQNCSSACGGEDHACHRSTGECLACEPGYFGSTCTHKCREGTFGQGCDKPCSRRCSGETTQVCDHVTGNCTNGCKPGYTGPLCNILCSPGTYGYDCNSTCSDFCAHSVCNHKIGVCYEGCLPGRYGMHCLQTCDSDNLIEGCRDCSRQCIGDAFGCHNLTGPCECLPGYSLPHCVEKCPDTRFGKNCENYCSSSCHGSLCNHETGECLSCPPGYFGSYCEIECPELTWGVNCSMNCSESCKDQECDGEDGTCLACYAGFALPTCETGQLTEDNRDSGWSLGSAGRIRLIFIGVLSGIAGFLLLSIVFGMMSWIRDREQDEARREVSRDGDIEDSFVDATSVVDVSRTGSRSQALGGFLNTTTTTTMARQKPGRAASRSASQTAAAVSMTGGSVSSASVSERDATAS